MRLSRVTRIVWSRNTAAAAMTMGSIVDSGHVPWPPWPNNRTSMLSSSDWRDPRAVGDLPGGRWHDVLAEDHVGLGEAVEHVVVDHALGSGPQLLGGLEQRDERSMPGIRRQREQLGGAWPAR